MERDMISKSNTTNEFKISFQFLFVTVTILTCVALIVSFFIAMIKNPTPQQLSLFEICSMLWKTGFLALLGLLGKKVFEVN